MHWFNYSQFLMIAYSPYFQCNSFVAEQISIDIIFINLIALNYHRVCCLRYQWKSQNLLRYCWIQFIFGTFRACRIIYIIQIVKYLNSTIMLQNWNDEFIQFITCIWLQNPIAPNLYQTLEICGHVFTMQLLLAKLNIWQLRENKWGKQVCILVTSFSWQHAPVWGWLFSVQPLDLPFWAKCPARILQLPNQHPIVPPESIMHPPNPFCTYTALTFPIVGLPGARDFHPDTPVICWIQTCLLSQSKTFL